MSNRLKKIISTLTVCFLLLSFLPARVAEAAPQLKDRLMVGYWHNFDNNSKVLKLREVNENWDVINVSFGETDATKDKATIIFKPEIQSEAEFISDVKYLQSKGKKVVLSIGGMYGVVELSDTAAKTRFVKSVSDLIDRYGFDGLDIDLEHAMKTSDDYKNPKVAQNVNLIAACKELHAKYGDNFILSMSPETDYVQGRLMSGSGGYLPLIYGVKDILTYISVQLYNSGGMNGSDGRPYTQGTPDFVVAMTEMLLNGFEVGWGTGNMFPALREDQVIIGLPACPEAAPVGGYVSNDDLNKAILALATGKSYGDTYKMQNTAGYSGLRGVMSWSANWDAAKNFNFSNNARKTLDSLKVIENTLQKGSLSSSAVVNGSFTLTANIPAKNTASSYEIFEGTTSLQKGNLTVGSSSIQSKIVTINNKKDGTYDYTVVVKDSSGKSLTSENYQLKISGGSGSGGGVINPPDPGKVIPDTINDAESIGNKKLMVGYWHNFDNGTGFIKLKNVNRTWDVYNVSFGEAPKDFCTVEFVPEYDENEFIGDIKTLHKEGKRVVLSLGGQNGVIHLDNDEKTDKFIKSCINIIDKYGFDGLDVDVEEGISLNGDTVDKPVSPRIVNLIKAIKQIKAHYGSNFIISAAPEVPYVQQGYSTFGGINGAYLPIINGIRDELSYLHVQYYNNGIPAAPDGSQYGANYARGTADSLVAMTDMLINGFDLGYGTAGRFKGLRPDQVMFGLPGSPGNTAAPSGGYVEPSEIIKACEYIIYGEAKSYGGKAKLSNPAGYSGFRGVMAWSVNWDTKYNNTFSTTVGNYIHKFKEDDILKPAKLSVSSIVDKSYTVTATIPSGNTATSYKFYEGTTLIKTGTLKAGDVEKTISFDFKGKQKGTYDYSIELTDGKDSVITKRSVEVTEQVVVPGAPDVNGDGKVALDDVALVASKYNTVYGQANYDAKCDMNGDGVIDIYDIVIVSSKIDPEKPNPFPNDTWVQGKQYYKGDIVIYHGEKYLCEKWDTNSEAPDNQWGPWKKVN
ncbi:glycosyl hydrolase family 18 protein [Clostridium sp. LP20]|uniref:glycosyl hydrolase family 18 protein n=1 Tax=Clostridium sp. LP20 TaxID=3418665 RepID=UPI003EE49671